jgi:hypothetical protein
MTVPAHLAPADLVRDSALIGPDAKFWCHPLGVCTAFEAPDRRGEFRGSYVQYLADGTRQEVTARFHVGHVAR